MAGLNHDFYLLSRDLYQPTDYIQLINASGALSLHNDIIHYILDTLNWLPTLNPAKNERQYSLCFFGPTVIDQQGASLAQSIFSTWAQLLSLGSEHLTLRGLYELDADNQPGGRYSKIYANRDDLVEKFRQLASYSERVSQSDKLYILHLGI